ncbi:DNA-protecting protein DprA [Haematospirillum sp. 15-248]|nr:DNA-protecting protein DprA [Haematospirillum sp. H4890]NKD74466.1 DNA-protecting protein DprA [Haematospirillum sp. H4485]NKD86863.1 DNA-protecting protein DprA [Haematospirillum sp. 15-248]
MTTLFSPPASTLSHSDKISWLRLIRSENVGPITFFKLLDRFGTPRDALNALPELARRGGRGKPIKICSTSTAEHELMTAKTVGARLLCAIEPNYPALLSAIDDAPPCIYIMGNESVLKNPCVSIVGARNASASARQLAWRLAMDLGKAGMTVVSGLARGIDTSAHEGSLQTGTIAVMAGGPDVIYPPENKDLYDKIRATGAIVSEMPPLTEPQARHFPRRNRIISGLSRGLVVMEATARSGSLITARMAAEQGRDVFAVPGSPLDPRSEGPNNLIRDGATLVRSADDILFALGNAGHTPFREPGHTRFSMGKPSHFNESTLAEAREIVGGLLSPAAVTVDEIIRQCQLSPAAVSMVLLELELAGRLERHPGGRVSMLA